MTNKNHITNANLELKSYVGTANRNMCKANTSYTINCLKTFYIYSILSENSFAL